MSVIAWISNINDDYLSQWANKGLLRRGHKQLQKLIDGELLSAWKLDESGAAGVIDGFEQALRAAGFEHLSCSCPAPGPCFHLIAFLLGLQRLAVKLSDQSANNIAEQLAVAALAQPDNNAPSAHSAEPELPPWLISDAAEREQLLGRTDISKALKLLVQNVAVDFQETASALTASVELKQIFTVYIPRTGGLAVSLCSCKKARCEHRALVILSCCIDQGLLQRPKDDCAITPWQKLVLQQLEQWLNQFAEQGMSSVSKLLLDHCERLTSELKQADLPKPAYLLSRVNALLRQEWQRQLISSSDRLRVALAELYAHLLALRSEPIAQPFKILAGEHKRSFKVIRNLDLFAIATEQWRPSVAGSNDINKRHKLKIYFYCPSQCRFYTVSYQVSTGQNLGNVYLGNYSLKTLLHSRFTLTHSWCSADGGLSTRQGTYIAEVAPLEFDALFAQRFSVNEQIAEIAEQMIANPYDRKAVRLAIVQCDAMNSLTFASITQQWQGTCVDIDGNNLLISIDGTLENAAAINKWQQFCQQSTAVFGRWQYQEQQLTFVPIALYGCNCAHYLHVDGAYAEVNYV